jgi:formylglycine-generating enzyme required for sulfatase activity
MRTVQYTWKTGDHENVLDIAFVRGTHGQPYCFGERGGPLIEIQDFFIATVPVTQAFWTHVIGRGANPSAHPGPDLPLENVAWDDLTQDGGFLDRLNSSPVPASILTTLGARGGTFRLPSETEWEYAARGGPAWRDNFWFSGSDDIDAVAWYDRRHGDHTQPVGQKAPNQLGLHDMSGNVWEWCQGVFTREIASIPQNGAPFAGPGEARVLRGGCFHNWAIHCTVSKRYEIANDYRDGCIGCRLVFTIEAEPGI